MKNRNVLLTVAVFLGMISGLTAQNVPSYVPTNGLVGWWPFNGNANDESGNNNNGTVNGATLTADRFGNSGKAYGFDGLNWISVQDANSLDFTTSFTISAWFNPTQFNIPDPGHTASNHIVSKIRTSNGGHLYHLGIDNSQNNFLYGGAFNYSTDNVYAYSTTSISLNNWHLGTITYDGTNLSIYLNGVLQNSSNKVLSLLNSAEPLQFGRVSGADPDREFFGKIDDIGLWNRALTECEVADLYNTKLGSFSNSSVSINPTSNAIGSNATLTVSTPIQSLQWQSNPGNMGWNNVVNNNNYNGSTNDTLVVSNVQLSNHNQPFRVLACVDTTNIATIQIANTCVTTVYDTLLTTVTDTLIINTKLSLPAPNNENTILIYPNPASDHITIDYGNYTAMTGYTIKITNNAGQEVFLNAINQQQFYVDLSTWTGNGLYFVHLIDSQNNTVSVRKIVIQ